MIAFVIKAKRSEVLWSVLAPHVGLECSIRELGASDGFKMLVSVTNGGLRILNREHLMR